MNTFTPESESELFLKLKWLMFFRVLFTSFLLGSTIVLQLGESMPPMASPLLRLYGLIVGIFLLSLIYGLCLYRIRRIAFFTYLQIGLDTVVVTLIILFTGGFTSIFSFLYLVVTIYSSMLLFMRGGMLTAVVCSFQYGCLMTLEYFGLLADSFRAEGPPGAEADWNQVLYKVLITAVGCFAVAFLSGYFSEQARRTKKELAAMKDRVRRVEKMAYMGEMAAGLAHEIKNPLASLAGSIQLLREDLQYSPDHDRLMQIVLRETDRLSSLVSNFLLFARPPVGKIEPIRLDLAVSETVALFEKDATCHRRIAIDTELCPDLWIAMDRVHLQQVLWNLLLNAAEAIEGPGRIELVVFALKNKFAGVSIRDDGVGIAPELLKSIFDPFFTTKVRGTGLGLSIVHRILEAYNGWLDVESHVDRGTVFTLNLKRIDPVVET